MLSVEGKSTIFGLQSNGQFSIVTQVKLWPFFGYGT